jgi:hypothetical protein
MSPTPVRAHLTRPLDPGVTKPPLRRYQITTQIEYKLLNDPDGGIQQGTGSTVTVSSGDVIFEAQRALPIRSPVEVLIDWPFLKDGVCRLKLVMHGRVATSEGQRVTVRALRYEFRRTLEC